ncbi:MAG: hypothetical protein H2172_06785 [Opitutus sp.]|nr:hypothetical protein [Opitutus sp.]MCS6246170.1 hypothetical protein [Opitutus sp.]MCS6272985.1 hypothetical protein [Opitutus sp.]MCS6278509.1 hypothetical protein [Opitutus sp.]MCS6300089.1 hypothetical protein [Opitutus sp.]
MASQKRIDRALNGPGPIEVTLGALMGIGLGVALGSLYLMLKPVEILTKPPEALVAADVYFVKGEVNSSKSRQWSRKQQLLSAGGAADVVFNEEELNAWVASATAKAPADPSKVVVPEWVNFRIRDGVMQVGIAGKFQAFEMTHPFVIQARGKFVPGANGFEFTADELYIGSLPTHKVPGLPQLIIQRALAAQKLPEELTAMWRNLKLVAVEDSAVHIIVP